MNDADPRERASANAADDAADPASTLPLDEPVAPAGTQRRPRIFYGWWIVLASSLTNGTGGAVQFQGFSVLFLPVTESLNLTRAATSLIFALARAENGILGPLTGYLIDRFGPRPLMFGGTIVVGIGYLLLSRADSYLSFLLIYIFVISLGASTSFMQAAMAALNTWFVRRRGLVMSINAAAFRGGGAIMIPGLAWWVLRYGWQSAALFIGAGMILFVAPLALAMRRSPETVGLGPDGDPLPRTGRQGPAGRGALARDSEPDWDVKAAIRTKAFYVLAAGTVFRLSATSAIFLHLIAILVWKGQSQQSAANMVGALAIVALPLTLGMGWISDRMGRRRLLSASWLLSALSLVLLTVVHGTAATFGALMLFGVGEAAITLNWALVGDLFGRRNFATIRGLLAPMYNLAVVVTTVSAGLLYDHTGSYRLVLFGGAALMIAAAVSFHSLRPPIRRSPPAGQ